MIRTNPISGRNNSVFNKIEFQTRGYSRPLVLAISLFLLAWNAASLRAQAPAAAQSQPDMTGKTAGQFYKNVKVLKDIPAVDLHPAMEYITFALGVGCGNCHDTKKFDSDDKANKRTARGMMQMEFALNSVMFDKQTRVTCYTCHRGQPEGAAFEVLPGDKAPPAVSPVAPIRQSRFQSCAGFTMAVVRANAPAVLRLPLLRHRQVQRSLPFCRPSKKSWRSICSP